MKTILVTGGAGYIGSHTILSLLRAGYDVISVDNFSNSTPDNFDALYRLTGILVKNYDVDLNVKEDVENIFIKNPNIGGIIHFAAYKYVGESSRDPIKYFHNNVNSLLNVLDCQEKYNVADIIFSSSCTVYGSPEILPVTETTPIQPAESPYGRTKQICEDILHDLVNNDFPIRSIILRYFNPAGIDASGLLVETTSKRQETLVPIIKEVFDGKREMLEVFGGDYDTRDGSAVRDYLHVSDLADAHVKSLSYLESMREDKFIEVFNLGLGNGVSVKEMIYAAESAYGRILNHKISPRRKGDVPATYSDISKANKKLNWHPQYSILDIFNSIK
ncbi:MAG: UDP-glucose 4-epimerase [Maribacter sp.]|jgi:UDP-glucose 4-epimerase